MATPKLTFNLAAIINQMSVSPAAKRAFLGVISDPDVKREIGKRIIDKILERTNNGIDKDDNRFAKYSKAYKASLAFRVYGKTNKVNLKLTGAMQSAIEVVSVGITSVTIGFTDGDEWQKAEGHIDGTGANDALPIRDFWGLPLKSKDMPSLDVESAIKETLKDIEQDPESFVDIVSEIPDVESGVTFRPSRLSVETADIDDLDGDF